MAAAVVPAAATPAPLPPAPAAAPAPALAVASPSPTAHATPTALADREAQANGALTDEPTATAEDAEAEPDWRAFIPTNDADHLATMARAARDSNCGVPWQLLAAISRIESDFGRNMATSSAGAIGYGQFLPSSWEAFGNAGNAYDYRDVLPAIARYLCQSGLARDPRAALFAYNHADWYVDMVLDLAVRYDRMAPGAPIPQVLNVGPGAHVDVELRYGQGRDVTQQARRRKVDATLWLGVPWRGRATGSSIEPGALQATALDALLAAFGASAARRTGADEPESFQDLAWQAGVLSWPTSSPSGWSLAEVRRRVDSGMPVMLYVQGAALPGHGAADLQTDQPLLVIGDSPTGLLVSDPSFASTLGYGIEIDDVVLLTAWQRASVPLQALAFSRAPRATAAHLAVAESPAVVPRVVVTPPPAAHSEFPQGLALPSTLEPLPIAPPRPPASVAAPAAPGRGEEDWSWLVLALGAMLAVGATLLRLRRGGRFARFDRAASAPPPADQ